MSEFGFNPLQAGAQKFSPAIGAQGTDGNIPGVGLGTQMPSLGSGMSLFGGGTDVFSGGSLTGGTPDITGGAGLNGGLTGGGPLAFLGQLQMMLGSVLQGIGEWTTQLQASAEARKAAGGAVPGGTPEPGSPQAQQQQIQQTTGAAPVEPESPEAQAQLAAAQAGGTAEPEPNGGTGSTTEPAPSGGSGTSEPDPSGGTGGSSDPAPSGGTPSATSKEDQLAVLNRLKAGFDSDNNKGDKTVWSETDLKNWRDQLERSGDPKDKAAVKVVDDMISNFDRLKAAGGENSQGISKETVDKMIAQVNDGKPVADQDFTTTTSADEGSNVRGALRQLKEDFKSKEFNKEDPEVWTKNELENWRDKLQKENGTDDKTAQGVQQLIDNYDTLKLADPVKGKEGLSAKGVDSILGKVENGEKISELSFTSTSDIDSNVKDVLGRLHENFDKGDLNTDGNKDTLSRKELTDFRKELEKRGDAADDIQALDQILERFDDLSAASGQKDGISKEVLQKAIDGMSDGKSLNDVRLDAANEGQAEGLKGIDLAKLDDDFGNGDDDRLGEDSLQKIIDSPEFKKMPTATQETIKALKANFNGIKDTIDGGGLGKEQLAKITAAVNDGYSINTLTPEILKKY